MHTYDFHISKIIIHHISRGWALHRNLIREKTLSAFILQLKVSWGFPYIAVIRTEATAKYMSPRLVSGNYTDFSSPVVTRYNCKDEVGAVG